MSKFVQSVYWWMKWTLDLNSVWHIGVSASCFVAKKKKTKMLSCRNIFTPYLKWCRRRHWFMMVLFIKIIHSIPSWVTTMIGNKTILYIHRHRTHHHHTTYTISYSMRIFSYLFPSSWSSSAFCHSDIPKNCPLCCGGVCVFLYVCMCVCTVQCAPIPFHAFYHFGHH